MTTVTETVNPWLGLDTLSVKLSRAFLFLWARTTVVPENPAELQVDTHKPIVYVLETRSFSNLLVLDQQCIRWKLPRPIVQPAMIGAPTRRAVITLDPESHQLGQRKKIPAYERILAELARKLDEDPEFDVQLIPVSIFWGRSPAREHTWFKILFSDSWAVAGRLRKFFIVLLHGRNILLQFHSPLSLRGSLQQGVEAPQAATNLAAALSLHFYQVRTATIGPDLSHRRTVVNTLLTSAAVRQAIADEIRSKNISELKASRAARRYAEEIAADYSYRMILLLERLLSRVWNQLYDGIEVNNIETIRDIAPGNGIVYVPCHRSHFDYLLLSYVLYQAGLAPPHVAAGINLNLPLIGKVLRRGGAFFIRRTFKDNPLYAAVFHEYLSINLGKGVAIEYFIEGGRSRTGRSLQPMLGMLSMTLQSFLSNPIRPLVFVPVYVGYERLAESRSYTAELAGAAKQKESLLGLLRSFKRLNEKFGRVYLNFGEPLFLETFLTAQHPGWQNTNPDSEQPPAWLAESVGVLGDEIMTRINSAAAVKPINLLALTLLSTPKQAMDENSLAEQLDLYLRLLAEAPYSWWCTVTPLSGREVIHYGEALGAVRRRRHELGDIIFLEAANAVSMTYFRNNILHLFILPAIIAACFINAPTMPLARVIQLAKLVYPYTRSELFLRWNESQLPAAIHKMVAVMTGLGLLERDDARGTLLRRPAVASPMGIKLMVLADSVIHTLERFYVTVALLLTAGPGKLSPTDLEHKCHLMAERISLLYEFNAPEFFDRSLFRNFIKTLGEMGLVWPDENGLLVYGKPFCSGYRDARILLSEQVRHSVLQVTQGVLGVDTEAQLGELAGSVERAPS